MWHTGIHRFFTAITQAIMAVILQQSFQHTISHTNMPTAIWLKVHMGTQDGPEFHLPCCMYNPVAEAFARLRSRNVPPYLP